MQILFNRIHAHINTQTRLARNLHILPVKSIGSSSIAL